MLGIVYLDFLLVSRFELDNCVVESLLAFRQLSKSFIQAVFYSLSLSISNQCLSYAFIRNCTAEASFAQVCQHKQFYLILAIDLI